MRSASEHPEPINAYVGSELSAGRMIQVAADTPGLRVSRFGVIGFASISASVPTCGGGKSSSRNGTEFLYVGVWSPYRRRTQLLPTRLGAGGVGHLRSVASGSSIGGRPNGNQCTSLSRNCYPSLCQ